jgi:PPOX class probable FMN-dependent enzyme
MHSNSEEPQDELRRNYGQPIERARLKVLRRLDAHCRKFISLSPFVCIGTSGENGADVSSRGDRPGFVSVLDDGTLALPDWPGNNRIDSLTNVLSNPRVGMLFLIPGVDETLRVNGTAEVTTDPTLLARWEANGKRPKSALRITIDEAFLHCGKALIRSRLWHNDYRIDRSELPSYGRMLKDQIEISDSADEIEASVAEGYRAQTVLSGATKKSKNTRVESTVFFLESLEAAQTLVDPSDHDVRHARGGRHKELNHNLISLYNRCPKAPTGTAVTGQVRTFHTLVGGIVNPHLRAFAQVECGETQTQVLRRWCLNTQAPQAAICQALPRA